MRLLGEPLKKVRIFQAHVVRKDMEAGMWVARCRVMHPGGMRGLPPRQKAPDEYASELNRSGLEEIPITKRFYMGLPPSKRSPLLTQWEIASPALERTLLDNWMQQKEGPAPMSRRGRNTIHGAAAAAMRKADPIGDWEGTRLTNHQQ